jgi:D-alanine-D-alanine ligase
MGTWTGKKVAVLYGGRSTEREVSLNSGKGCAEALRARGHDAFLLDVDLEVAARLREARAEVAFIALHGRWGEDGAIQGLLESMGIPYTGSGVLASALGMDKILSKLLFREHGLAVIEHRVFPPQQAGRVTASELPFGLPVVVKPAGEGSSVGVHLVRDAAALEDACLDAARFKGDVMVEPFVKGVEVNVAVLDGKALGAIEIVPSHELYDYESKYLPGGSKHYYPARLPDPQYRSVCAAAEKAHQVLGCSGITRSDFIVTPDGTAYILEVNTLPGMTSTSLVPEIAAGNGISFAELCERLLETASLKA